MRKLNATYKFSIGQAIFDGKSPANIRHQKNV